MSLQNIIPQNVLPLCYLLTQLNQMPVTLYLRNAFTLRLSFPFSDWNMGSKMLASKKLAFSISFSVREWV